jgi:hypothetical protein
MRRGFAILAGCVGALVISQGAMASTTTTTFPTTVRQPPQQSVHLAKRLPPLPAIRTALRKQYRSAIPLLNAGLRVFEYVDNNGNRVRITNLDDFQSQTLGKNSADPGGLYPDDPNNVVTSLSGTVIDSSGRSWDVSLMGGANFSGGDLNLQGLCGKGRPAPASQQIPGSVNHPCKQIQIGFGPEGLNPRTATIAEWTTVKTTIGVPLPGSSQG